MAFVSDLDFDSFVEGLDSLEDADLRNSLQVGKLLPAAFASEATASKPCAKCFQDLKAAEAAEEGKRDDTTWQRHFVRAMNHVVLKKAQQEAQKASCVEDEETKSVSAASATSRCAPYSCTLGIADVHHT